MKPLRAMFNDLKHGLSRKKKLGPLGQAVEVCNQIIRHCLQNNLYESSVIYKSVHIILDNLRCQREALDAAAELVNIWESSKADVTQIENSLLKFKAAAVKARVAEYVPLENIPKLEIVLGKIQLQH